MGVKETLQIIKTEVTCRIGSLFQPASAPKHGDAAIGQTPPNTNIVRKGIVNQF